MEEKKEKQLKQVKSEVLSLNASLKELGDKKEAGYKEKTLLENKLNKLINSANELKKQKAVVDAKITELKKKREEKNKIVQDSIKELHKAKKSQKTSKKSIIRKKDIKKQIRDLEFAVQTEVLNFKKEKSYMDKIKLLKKELTEITQKLGETGEIKAIQDKIKASKEVADEFHKQVQEASKESSQIFTNLTKISREIADIKKKRSTMRASLKGLKSQINQVNTVLTKKLGNLGTLPKVTGRAMLDGAKASAGLIQKKTEAVKDKFKKKKKLSKDDILLLQREAMGKDKKR